jgi:CO dehydrogenase/acetyl-CoA synthase gamma subunit (corrinoid Fe-S protein)
MGLSGVQIFKLLPKTNCQECGLPTCLAFAMNLSYGNVELESCPHISDEALVKLTEASMPPIRTVKIGRGERAFKVGGETVLFRHEKGFLNPTAFAAMLYADISEADLDAKLKKWTEFQYPREFFTKIIPISTDALKIYIRSRDINISSLRSSLVADFIPGASNELSSEMSAWPPIVYKVERSFSNLRPELVALKDTNGDKAAFANAAKTIAETSEFNLVLMTDHVEVMKAGIEASGFKRPLIYAATHDNADDYGNLAKEHNLPLAVKADSVDGLLELSHKLKKMELKDLILDPGSREIKQALEDQVAIRRAAIKDLNRPAGFPTITFPCEMALNLDMETIIAAMFVAKYSSIVVLSDFEGESIFPLLLLRFDLFKNPQTEPMLRYRPESHYAFEAEFEAAFDEGFEALEIYGQAAAEEQIILNEAKLILVGEGEVGKTSLLRALRGEEFIEGLPPTHGIEIKPLSVTDSDSDVEITLNCWDFGGQPVYRPTHQLFFSTDAAYLVVWKPREGPQQGFVSEWIKLIKHRNRDAKILVVATHGGPQDRQPDIDRQELWDLFGRDTVVNFFHIDSKPNENGERPGIASLKEAIASVAAKLPGVGRPVAKSLQDLREAMVQTGKAYLPLERVYELSTDKNDDRDNKKAKTFVRILHRLGHLIHYEYDPLLRDIVVLKPDWLATAVSFVLNDKITREANGLVPFGRLVELWNDPNQKEEFRYPENLHPIFLRLMERFDLSYRVASLSLPDETESISLIAQLVSDIRPEELLAKAWPSALESGDIQQTQICRIVNEKGESANAEGLFYRLIVRLHKYSLGRENYNDSIHWQRGLVLDAAYNGRALLRHIDNDVHITVRALYPEGLLAMLTSEVKYLVESFWPNLRCKVMVPCVHPCGNNAPGTALFEVEKLIDSKRKKHLDYPCPLCLDWQNIDHLLRNAPSAQPDAAEGLFAEFAEVQQQLALIHKQLMVQGERNIKRFDELNENGRRILSRVDNAVTDLIRALTDEAKEGPRLFSLEPVDTRFLDKPKWISAKFRLTLWCEHSRLPLTALNPEGDKRGVYELDLPRDWLVRAAPFLKVVAGTLGFVVPVAFASTKVTMAETAYKEIEKQLDLGQKCLDAMIKGTEKAADLQGDVELTPDRVREAHGGDLRQLHDWLKAKDVSFGGLERVMDKQQKYLWVHPKFKDEY